MAYAKISDLVRRWKVDRTTVRAALQAAQILRSEYHASPRFPWEDILRKIENLPDDQISTADFDDNLLCANELADRLGVTPQTVRNYGHRGLVHFVKITPKIIRYRIPGIRDSGGEEKIADSPKK